MNKRVSASIIQTEEPAKTREQMTFLPFNSKQPPTSFDEKNEQPGLSDNQAERESTSVPQEEMEDIPETSFDFYPLTPRL